MKSKKIKVISISLAVILSAGLCAGGINAIANNSKDTSNRVLAEANDTSKTDVATSSDTSEATKEETVYVIANSDGSVDHLIVSDWLKNTLGKDDLKDVSNLSDIINVKGDETFTQDGDNTTWSTDGKDIYYRGSTDKLLPIEMSITYKLDGNTISAEDLAGKSGKVTIHFDYKNNEKSGDVYVPFVMLTGMILNNDTFTNVEVSNGKLINDGTNSIIIGYALPGMQENLGIDKETFEIPTSFEVTADVKNYSLSNTVSIALNDVFSNISLDSETGKLDVDSLTSSLTDLDSAATKLVNGSSDLSNGASDLSSGTAKLQAAVKTLYSKVQELSTGLNSAYDGSNKIVAGLKDVGKGNDDLTTGLGSLSSNLSVLSAGMDTAANGLKATIAGDKQALAGLKQLYAQVPTDSVKSLISVLEQTIAGQEQVLASLTTGNSKSLKDGATSLIAGTNSLITGSKTLRAGITDLYNGSITLNTGLKTASEGGIALVSGVKTLYDSTGTLNTGAASLSAGAKTLSSGIAEFYKSGIEALVSTVDSTLGNVDGLAANIQKTIDASKDYKSFSGISDKMDGSVKFIYKTGK